MQLKITKVHCPQLTKLQHKRIVAGGLVGCTIVAVIFPDWGHANAVGSCVVNFIWLFVEPTA